MKVGMFRTREEMAEYLNNMADAIEANGLRIARERLANPEPGTDIAWLKGEVKYLERKVRSYRRKALNA